MIPALAGVGSSPLTRGKLSAEKPDFLTGRLIPAHAGKTPGRRGGVPRARAHPRSRGENATAAASGDLPDGSSPLTRGKPKQALRTSRRGRLIPAHAGKTVFIIVVVATETAHPRSRGENMCRRSRWPRSWGSSPLTRGKLPGKQGLHLRPRLIPAHAGKTGMPSTESSRDSAHPRSRGENLKQVARDVNKAGSSPLTRGKLSHGWWGAFSLRLIPAHAGKTRTRLHRRPRSTAHPRSRGENSRWMILSML